MPLPAVYLPSPSQQLMISEPRYRELYDDVLASGGRRFVVTCEREGRLAEVGVVFHLDDLREVSESTNGRVKYIGEHSVCERVRILSFDNPEAYHDKSTYLKAEVELLGSTSASTENTSHGEPQELRSLRSTLAEVVELQREIGEDPRLPEAVLRSPSFWDICGSLGSLLAYRLELRVQQMHSEVRRLTQAWAKDNPQDFEALKRDPGVLPDVIRRRGKEAREVYADGSEKLQGAFQRILQCTDAKECHLALTELMDEEYRRLLAKRSLRGLFDDDATGSNTGP